MRAMHHVLAAAASILAMSATAHANLLTNGSFETPAVTAGSDKSYDGGSADITGWTVTGPHVALVSGTYVQNGVTFNAQDLAQWLDLTGITSNAVEGVSQTVATVAGDEYQLSYYIGNTTGGGGIFGTTSTVDVLLDGALTFSDTNAAVDATGLSWAQVTHTFVATGASTILGFQNADPGSDNSNGLDSVVLLDLGPAGPPPPASAPEPGSLVLLGAALAGLTVVRRRTRP